jgi:hypothetical protein
VLFTLFLNKKKKKERKNADSVLLVVVYNKSSIELDSSH